ncbi:hypothetical protein OV450_1349 [Actinobacteria bacterium OV450]|nr:hypothetical protein OV450_1349 [Actinobacteria bacterium OV450]
MARKSFALNTENHVADVGGTELLFYPEVDSDQFLDAYEQLQAAYKGANIDPSDLASISVERLRAITGSLRSFLTDFMLPESASVFTRWEVRVGDTVTGTYRTEADAQSAAEGQVGAEVVNAGMRLPDRVLVQLMEFVMEVYGRRPTGSSSDSAPPSPSRGSRGTGRSPSRASTPAVGPSAGS